MTFPDFTIANVEKIFSNNFVAVPAFSRVDPVNNSGPKSGAITIAG